MTTGLHNSTSQWNMVQGRTEAAELPGEGQGFTLKKSHVHVYARECVRVADTDGGGGEDSTKFWRPLRIILR